MNQSFMSPYQGPSEFGISGKLENGIEKAVEKKLTVPTLSHRSKNTTRWIQNTWKKFQNLTKWFDRFCPTKVTWHFTMIWKERITTD